MMSLDVYLTYEDQEESAYWANITHNLAQMADAAGIYYHLWRPGEIGIKKAIQLITPLYEGLQRLKTWPQAFRQLNASNGWGTYEHFVPWIEQYLTACCQHPYADVEVSR